MHIRPARDADLPALTDLYNHYILNTPATFDLEPFTVERRRREWFSRFADTGPHRLLVADDHGDILGMTYSGPFRPKAAYQSSVETSVYCRHDTTGRGLGRQLYEALFNALADQPLHQAFALITLPNDPSETLHRRLHFQHSGTLKAPGRKFDQYWDVAIWQRPIRI